MGNRYAELGEPEKAISYYEQAFEIYRVIGDRDGERVNLGNLAERLIELGEYAKAIEHTLVAIRIGEEIGNPKGGSYGNQRLASAHFYAGNLKAAQEAISAARAYDVPENNHNVHALVGVIAARLGEWSGAVSAFQEAVTAADDILAKTAEYYDALDAKGLALAGLAVCAVKNYLHPPTPSPLRSEEELGQAIEAYRAARAIISAKGIINRVLRLHDALAVVAEGDADLIAQLAEVRKVAAGQSSQGQ